MFFNIKYNKKKPLSIVVLWKAILLGAIIFSAISAHITLYWQSRITDSFKKVLTWIACTFVIAIVASYLFAYPGYYLTLISSILLGLFTTPSSRNFYNSPEALIINDDILDANL